MLLSTSRILILNGLLLNDFFIALTMAEHVGRRDVKTTQRSIMENRDLSDGPSHQQRQRREVSSDHVVFDDQILFALGGSAATQSNEPSVAPLSPPFPISSTNSPFQPSENSSLPSLKPSIQPTEAPTSNPSVTPHSSSPTKFPTRKSSSPTEQPKTHNPTLNPTNDPTEKPISSKPSSSPTKQPKTHSPTLNPTNDPTEKPISSKPSSSPTKQPKTRNP